MSAIRHYSNPQTCIDEVAAVKWPSGQAVCPRCDSKRATYLSTRLLWKCKDCKKQFSVKVGTIFEDSAVGLGKWLCAMWMMANCKNGVSSYEIGKASVELLRHSIESAQQEIDLAPREILLKSKLCLRESTAPAAK